MSKHKSEDYKISAVNYYLDNDVNMDYVCNIFNCKKQSLSRWVQRYNNDKSIKRYNRKPMQLKCGSVIREDVIQDNTYY